MNKKISTQNFKTLLTQTLITWIKKGNKMIDKGESIILTLMMRHQSCHQTPSSPKGENIAQKCPLIPNPKPPKKRRKKKKDKKKSSRDNTNELTTRSKRQHAEQKRYNSTASTPIESGNNQAIIKHSSSAINTYAPIQVVHANNKNKEYISNILNTLQIDSLIENAKKKSNQLNYLYYLDNIKNKLKNIRASS